MFRYHEDCSIPKKWLKQVSNIGLTVNGNSPIDSTEHPCIDINYIVPSDWGKLVRRISTLDWERRSQTGRAGLPCTG